MKYLLLAGAIALAGWSTSAQAKYELDAHGCLSAEISLDETEGFDKLFGPQVRYSVEFQQAQARQRAGECNAVRDYLWTVHVPRKLGAKP